MGPVSGMTAREKQHKTDLWQAAEAFMMTLPEAGRAPSRGPAGELEQPPMQAEGQRGNCLFLHTVIFFSP